MNSESSSVSRRTFLAGTAGTAAAAAMGTRLVRAESAAEKKTVGVAIVGIGKLTLGQLLPAFADAKVAKLVAFVSGHPDKAREQADKFGVDRKNIYNYENFDSIKDNPAIDVVYIVLPNSMHAEYTIRAAKAGKHVLCEKPMANSVAECQEMIAACKAAQKKLMVAYRMRYEPMTVKAIELAQSPKATGTIKHIRAEAGFPIGDPTQWRLKKAMAGGGPLMDMGVYAINAVRYLSGKEPVEVTASTYTTPGDPRFTDVEETVNFELRFKEGFTASGLTTYGFNSKRFRVSGTAGGLESEPYQSYSGNHLWQLDKNNKRTEVEYQPINHFAAEMDHLGDCILNDKPVLTPGEEGLQDIKIVTAIYEAARTGGVVKV
jgi:predicted dehydrogenase